MLQSLLYKPLLGEDNQHFLSQRLAISVYHHLSPADRLLGANPEVFTSVEGTVNIPAQQIFVQYSLLKMTGASHHTCLPFDVSRLVANRAVWLWDKAVKAGEGSWAFSFPCQSPLLFFFSPFCASISCFCSKTSPLPKHWQLEINIRPSQATQV